MRYILLLALLVAGCAQPPEVNVTTPTVGTIVESFTEQAETRLIERFPVTLPVSGRIDRIELEEGDPVREGQVLVGFDAVPVESREAQALQQVAEIEARLQLLRDVSVERAQKAQAAQQVEALRSARQAQQAAAQTARAVYQQALTDLERSQRLFRQDAIPEQQLEEARLAAEQARLALAEQRQRIESQSNEIQAAATRIDQVEAQIQRQLSEQEALRHQLEQARSQLRVARHEVAQSQILSPITGVVLERKEQGPRELPAGTELLVLGRPGQIEVVADVLTQDALKIRPGTPVQLDPGGGAPVLSGTVKRIEPGGFTKLSSLGVEQQRVNVVVGVSDPPAALGVGYELQAQFIVEREEEALMVNRYSVLQERDGTYYVFVVMGGKLKKQPIEIGLRGDQHYQVTAGLEPSTPIVETPDPAYQEGDEVKAVTP